MDPDKLNLYYGAESVIVESGNRQVRCPAYPTECDYIRIVAIDGDNTHEITYWNKDEWQDDPDLDCIGAIMGAIKDVAGASEND